jgi:hypothetical protein
MKDYIISGADDWDCLGNFLELGVRLKEAEEAKVVIILPNRLDFYTSIATAVGQIYPGFDDSLSLDHPGARIVIDSTSKSVELRSIW